MANKAILYIKSKLRPYKIKFKTMLIPKFYKKASDIDLAPVFVIGTNRSGTSIFTYILNQHPELEGLFEGNTEPGQKNVRNHIPGYCESTHIWDWLNNDSYFFQNKSQDHVLWCHPQAVSSLYRNDVKNEKESVLLANAIRNLMKTENRPLIKDQFNLFRIPLIKKAFPKAKFVFVYREYKHYIKSCNHTWFESKNAKPGSSIGLHWLNGNTTAYYDLYHHAPNDFITINYNKFVANKEYAQEMLELVTQNAGLKNFEYDLSKINLKHQYLENKEYNDFNMNFLDSIVDFEREVLK
jgi:hypothetical protein